MGDERSKQEDDDGDRDWPDLPLSPPGERGLEAQIGPPAANRSAAPRNADMPPSVTTKGGFKPGDREALDAAASETDLTAASAARPQP